MSKRYSIHVPGHAYAFTFYGANESEARAAARNSLRVARLPKGTAVWEA